MQKKILDITFLDILKPSIWLTPHFIRNDNNIETPLNFYFKLRGYKTNLVFDNLGSSLVYLGIIEVLIASLLVLNIASKV